MLCYVTQTVKLESVYTVRICEALIRSVQLKSVNRCAPSELF